MIPEDKLLQLLCEVKRSVESLVSPDDKARVTVDTVKRIARMDFRAGSYVQMEELSRILHDLLEKAVCDTYYLTIESLIKERICPCCGQPTLGDIDW